MGERFNMSVLGRNIIAVRRFTTSAIKQGGYHHIPPPGHNLPFQISNRYRLTLMMSCSLAVDSSFHSLLSDINFSRSKNVIKMIQPEIHRSILFIVVKINQYIEQQTTGNKI